MQLSEKEVEDFIFEDLTFHNGFGLSMRGLRLPSMEQNVLCKRQLNIDPYGIIDIAGFYRINGEIHVDLLELKAVEIHPDHFEQICRYKKGLSDYLNNTFTNPRILINMFLIGSGYDGLYIQNDINVNVSKYEYNLKGLTFKQHDPFSGWHITSAKDCSFRKTRSNGKKVY